MFPVVLYYHTDVDQFIFSPRIATICHPIFGFLLTYICIIIRVLELPCYDSFYCTRFESVSSPTLINITF